MRKLSLLMLAGLFFAGIGHAQVSVTNPGNTTPNLAATYPSLASAITDLNTITSISGPVVITLNAGNPQTAPAGGYTIQFAATTTTANNITITGSNNIITAFTPQTAGNLNDAIFKLIGADHITLSGFTMQENAANSISTEFNNNMTEFGVALLRASTTDGAQENTIQDNTISLKRTYQNSFGIYSNVLHTATAVTAFSDISSVGGSNYGNKIYSNAISNTGTGIVFIGSTVAARMDNGNDIGGGSVATANTITNWGSINVALAAFVSISTSSICVLMNHQVNENVSYNTITSAAVSLSTYNLVGIVKAYYLGQPSGTITSVINNNTITLNSINSFTSYVEGIFNQDLTALATATLTMNNNTIVNCTISGGGGITTFIGIGNDSEPGILNISNNTIRGTTSSSTSGGFFGIYNLAAVLTTINITGNKIGDAIAGAISFSAATSGTIYCIVNNGAAPTATVNLNNNSIDGISGLTTGDANFISNFGASGVAVNMNNNSLGSVTGNLITFNGPQSSNLFGLYNDNTGGACVVTMQGNDIRGIVHAVTGSSTHQYIRSQAATVSVNILNNTFTNLSVNTTGSVYFMIRGDNMTPANVSNYNNNSIVTAFNKSAPGNGIFFFYSGASSVNGSVMTETGNNFSNVTVTGATFIYGWFNYEGSSASNGPTKTITGNTFNNITGGSGEIDIMLMDNGAATTCASNTFSNVSSTGDIFALYHGFHNGQGTHSISSNNFSNISSTGAGGVVFGIYTASSSVPTLNINGNTLTGFSSTSANADVTAINIDDGATVNIYDNLVNNLSSSGTVSPVVNGIVINSAATANVYRNRIYNLLQSGAISATSPAMNGILITGGTTVTAYNNFVSDLKAPAANLTDAIRGISITSVSASSTYNLYYNSVYLNAVSSGTNFGTSGIYHTSNATSTTAALNMIDNIIVNTSTANGTGSAAAFRRSGTALNNYTTTSDHNLFYAGTPGASKLIYYDGTNADQGLAAYQTRVSTRDANSISVMPNFSSATDLHLTAANNCAIKGAGEPVAGITTDYDVQARDVTTPDIGADEFVATYNTVLAGIVGSGVCQNKIVSPSGTTYATGSCDLIAKVLPSGGSPVTGQINTCVTLQTTQQYFNGEPYVQRHHDIEPAVNPATSTATVTLYFYDAEFVAYNTNNPAWPKLPTLAGGANADPNRTNLRVTQFHGTPISFPSTPGNYMNPGTVSVINPGIGNIFWNGTFWEISFPVTGFSGFYVHSTVFGTPLPIVVNYFTGIKQNGNHLLNWKVTCMTSPTAIMEIQRSTDGRNYTGIYSVTATAVQCQQPFAYTDNQPAKGVNYYRLKLTDVNGKITYSNIVPLINADNGFEVMNIAPNPIVNRNFNLNVSAAQKTTMEIVIIDMQGRVMRKQTANMIAGFNSIPVNVANFASGTYQVYGVTTEGRSKVLRFVIQ